MKITTRIVLQHFLSVLLKKLQKVKTQELDAFFDDFFTKEEITEILQSTYGKNVQGHLKVVRLNNEQLLEHLSNADVLMYFLEDWNTEIKKNIALSPVEVMKTLEQLGHQTHYLASKAIAFWDSYDFSNYRSLCRKAGKTSTVYGIYNIDVKAEDVEQVSSHPKRFYENYDNAKAGLEELISVGKFKKEEVHILPRLVGTV